MHSEFLCTMSSQITVGLHQLVLGHAVLGIPRIVHNGIGDLEEPTRIKPAGNALRNPAYLLQHGNVCDIIQINGSSQLGSIGKFLSRCIIRGEHDLLSHDTALL